MGAMVVFGYAAHGVSATGRERMAQLCAVVSELSGCEMAIAEAATYEDLAALLHKKEIDVAWLPPIPFIALEQKKSVVPLASCHRGQSSQFLAVLIVRADSVLQEARDLDGTSAAWVDPHSASGYVLPRIRLASLGIDPRSAFTAETFFRSHEAVARAVIDGAADFGATYAGTDGAGTIARGPWIDVPEGEAAVRVLDAFGPVPGDVIAARVDVDPRVSDKVAQAFIAASRDKGNRLLLRDVFGVDEFRRWAPGGYDELRAAAMAASAQGLLEGEERGAARAE